MGLMDDRSPTSDRLRNLASRYEDEVSQSRAEQLAARSLARAVVVAPHRVLRRVAAAGAGITLSIGALFGIAALADSAVPGDFLYPIDRTFEIVGFSNDVLEERLEEAIKLAERGDRERAIRAATAVLEEVDRSGLVDRTATTTSAPPDTLGATTPPTTPPTTAPQGDRPIGDPMTTTPPAAPTATAPTIAPPTTVLAAPAEEDPILVIRLQAENLLRTIRDAGDDPESAAAIGEAVDSLAMAVSAAEAAATSTTTSTTAPASSTSSPPTSSSEPSTSTTEPASSTSSSTSTTSSTAPASSTSSPPTSSTTSTTEPDSSTTSTTVPDDGGGDDGAGDGAGGDRPPITLPPP
jgi:hypothetical protein